MVLLAAADIDDRVSGTQWYDELLNNFMETIENLNLPYILHSSIMPRVSSMSILRYRFSPLPWSGLFFACAAGGNGDLSAGNSRTGTSKEQARNKRPAGDVGPCNSIARQDAVLRVRNGKDEGDQAFSRPRIDVSSLRMATRSIGTLAAPAATSERLSSWLRAPLIVNPYSYSSSRIRRISSTSWCW